ncbi:hypothetical protein ANN_18879 [Periplaneta americana]|uniref:Tc1-like transposase DDE domain-containing protein n=1 Tax=Periplaneta americana TaxID=6978 RepID=A0ABQ8SQQ6_PERAM|nr:hypothetical protein ANN_18879 [Periplaneta americana]
MGFLEFGKDATTLPPRGFERSLSILLNEGCDWLIRREDKISVTVRKTFIYDNQLVGGSRRSLPSKETLRGHSDSSFRGEGYIQCCVGVRLCDMYSNQELAEIHFMYGKADGNAALARRLYQERGRPRSTTPEVQDGILEAVNMTPSISTRRVALQVNVPHTTVWILLKEYQLYPYHLQRVQALSPADYPARVRFCQWFLQQCGVNPNFPALVLFTDEAQFTRDGVTNFHYQHVWAYENPRATVPSHHQVRFSLNMWAGIIGDRLVGPHILVNRLTGQAYTNFLENTIPHVLEDTLLINRQHIHFLHDGAPAHFSRTARRYLDRRFPDRWIDRGSPIAWPPRSPDLNPLDFYLWGHLKSLVYSSPVPDLESLRNRIVACSEDIRNTLGVWDRVRREIIQILMIFGYGDRQRSHREAANLFNGMHPDRNPIPHTTVTTNVRKFTETGSVKDLPRSGRPKCATDDNTSLDVLLRFSQRWIARRCHIEWPATSPDLSPLDFFLWGHLKSVVYRERPNNLEDLEHPIMEVVQDIPKAWLNHP